MDDANKFHNENQATGSLSLRYFNILDVDSI